MRATFLIPEMADRTLPTLTQGWPSTFRPGQAHIIITDLNNLLFPPLSHICHHKTRSGLQLSADWDAHVGQMQTEHHVTLCIAMDFGSLALPGEMVHHRTRLVSMKLKNVLYLLH